jgi:hypothetical protein
MESNKYILSDSEKEFIPYAINETINFIHSEGFEFNLNVINKNTEFRKTETDHCGDDYTSYEALNLELESSIPELYINVEINPNNLSPYLIISVNKNNFYINMRQNPDIETVTINGKEFYNVYQTESNIVDTSLITPKQILYNKEIGIIKITMTNNETFTINK